MKLTLKAVGVALLCAGFAPVIRPEIVRVRMYKTDPTTWNKPFYYNVRTQQERKTIETSVLPKETRLNKTKRAILAARTPKITENRPSIIRPPKPIKKDATISFDNEDKNILHVCSKPITEPNPECGSLILSTGDPEKEAEYTTGNVIAIDKDYQLISRPKSVVDQLIKDNQAKFFKIPVYKTDPETWGQKWTITLLNGNEEPYPDATITISQNSDWTKKLLMQKNIELGSTYVRVRKPGRQVDTPLDTPVNIPWEQQALAIDADGLATIINKSLYKSTPKAPKQSRLIEEQGIPLPNLPPVSM